MLGALLAPIGIRGLSCIESFKHPRAGEIGLDAPVLTFSVLVSLWRPSSSGLAPALRPTHGI